MNSAESRHPVQPLVTDNQGVVRFKENKIVTHLLDNSGIDMNQLAWLDFEQNDREQFAQLIGYSLDGFGSLSYVSDEVYDKAGQSDSAEVERLRGENAALREFYNAQGGGKKSCGHEFDCRCASDAVKALKESE